jgi:hypothetical protein
MPYLTAKRFKLTPAKMQGASNGGFKRPLDTRPLNTTRRARAFYASAAKSMNPSEEKTMHRSIILECQTKIVNPNCDDCIVNKTCNLRKEISKYDAELKVDL